MQIKCGSTIQFVTWNLVEMLTPDSDSGSLSLSLLLSLSPALSSFAFAFDCDTCSAACLVSIFHLLAQSIWLFTFIFVAVAVVVVFVVFCCYLLYFPAMRKFKIHASRAAAFPAKIAGNGCALANDIRSQQTKYKLIEISNSQI